MLLCEKQDMHVFKCKLHTNTYGDLGGGGEGGGTGGKSSENSELHFE
jgi:hypothetical protein